MAAKVKVVVERGNVLYVDGRSYGEGESLAVTPAVAKQLREDGAVEQPK